MNPMRRRLLAAASVSALAPRIALSEGGCTPRSYLSGQPGQIMQMPQICNAFIDPKSIVVAGQQNSEWCWAAAVSMIFASRGFEVDQTDIVQKGIGSIANRPGDLNAINNVLNATWTDKGGKQFTSSAKILFSLDLRIGSLSNSEIIDALQNNHPLLYCNFSHAMMLVQVNYIPPANKPRNVIAALVVDPWPGIGLRSLSSQELQTPPFPNAQARLIAQIDVS